MHDPAVTLILFHDTVCLFIPHGYLLIKGTCTCIYLSIFFQNLLNGKIINMSSFKRQKFTWGMDYHTYLKILISQRMNHVEALVLQYICSKLSYCHLSKPYICPFCQIQFGLTLHVMTASAKGKLWKFWTGLTILTRHNALTHKPGLKVHEPVKCISQTYSQNCYSHASGCLFHQKTKVYLRNGKHILKNNSFLKIIMRSMVLQYISRNEVIVAVAIHCACKFIWALSDVMTA